MKLRNHTPAGRLLLNKLRPPMLLCLILLGTIVLVGRASSEITNPQLVTQGSDGAPANDSSFAPNASVDGRFITYMSFANNWYPEDNEGNGCLPDPNCMDVFLHDRVTGDTILVSRAYDGGTANEESVEPGISLDGNLVIYSSYASNIVPGDTNDYNIFTRDGLDVFIYNRQTDTNQRVSLNYQGKEIDGNNNGTLSGDDKTLFLLSEGTNVMPGVAPDPICHDLPNYHCNLIYVKDMATGAMQQIGWGFDNKPPNDVMVTTNTDYYGRYLGLLSHATNLDPAATNPAHHQAFYIDRVTGEFHLISKSAGGVAGNGSSGQPQVSLDGRYIIFRSWASNLVPNDTNGVPDVFLYDIASDSLTLVSRSHDGSQANGLSRDPSICADGSFLTYTSEATNIVPGDTNGFRDAFLYDVIHDEVRIISKPLSGQQANGDTHKSVISLDCDSVVFATDATNFFPNDNNNARDILWAELVKPPAFDDSTVRMTGQADPGGIVTVTVHVQNSGGESGQATVAVPLPPNTSYVPASVTNGGSYNAGQDTVNWQGNVGPEAENSFSFQMEIDAGLTGFTLINLEAAISGDNLVHAPDAVTVVNPVSGIYLPWLQHQPLPLPPYLDQ